MFTILCLIVSACSSYSNKITVIDDIKHSQPIYLNCEAKDNACFYTLPPKKKVVIDNIKEITIVWEQKIYKIELLPDTKAQIKLSTLFNMSEKKHLLKNNCKRIVMFNAKKVVNCNTGQLTMNTMKRKSSQA